RRPLLGGLTAGRLGGPHRPHRARSDRDPGPCPVALHRRAPHAARRPGRLPHPRRRIVLLRTGGWRTHHHHRPGTGHQPTVGGARRGHVRRPPPRRSGELPAVLRRTPGGEPPRAPRLRHVSHHRSP